jgi:two-component system sensor histidine kinase UhpB
VGEALANVAKHAYSHHTWVTLESTSGVVMVKVRDDGRGFSSSQPHGHGLGIMAERAALVGATVEVRSAPGQGTEVVITCPCE